MTRQGLIKIFGALGALAAAAALALDGKMAEAFGVVSAALSSSSFMKGETP